MNEVSYFTIRAQHYQRLADQTAEVKLKEAYEAIVADMSAKAVKADPNREVFLIDGVAVDTSIEAVETHRDEISESAELIPLQPAIRPS